MELCHTVAAYFNMDVVVVLYKDTRSVPGTPVGTLGVIEGRGADCNLPQLNRLCCSTLSRRRMLPKRFRLSFPSITNVTGASSRDLTENIISLAFWDWSASRWYPSMLSYSLLAGECICSLGHWMRGTSWYRPCRKSPERGLGYCNPEGGG